MSEYMCINVYICVCMCMCLYVHAFVCEHMYVNEEVIFGSELNHISYGKK